MGTIVFGYFFLYFCSESVAELFFENQLVFSTTIFHNNSFKITGSVKSATIEEYKEYIIDARNSMDEYCQEWIDLLFPTEIQQENDFFCYTEINGKSEYINRYEIYLCQTWKEDNFLDYALEKTRLLSIHINTSIPLSSNDLFIKP